MGNKQTCHHVDSSENVSNLMKHYKHYSNEQGSVSNSAELRSNHVDKHHSIMIDEIEKSNPTLWRHYIVQYYIKTCFDEKTSSLDEFLSQLSKSKMKDVERELKTALLQYRLSLYHFPNQHPHQHENNDALHVSFIEDFFRTIPPTSTQIKKKE